MWSLSRNIALLAFCSVLASFSEAGAELYGFAAYHPFDPDQETLGLDAIPLQIRNYRADMRDNLLMMIDYARSQNPNFQVITHQGEELLSKSRWEYDREGYNRARRQKVSAEDPWFLSEDSPDLEEPEAGTPAWRYLHSLNGIVYNNLYCGKNKVDPLAHRHQLDLVSVDNCPDETALNSSIMQSVLDGRTIYGFTDLKRAFNNIGHQVMINDSAKNIAGVKDARNLLILDDDRYYPDKQTFLDKLGNSNYDILVIKPLFHHSERFSADEIRSLQFKKNGARRLLIAEMNVSETSPEDYFWQPHWKVGQPSWLARQSFSNQNGVITKYWMEPWKQIISKHFKDIVNSGFDGVFFTGIENHRYFENLTPLE